jgi:erythromycin esterase
MKIHVLTTILSTALVFLHAGVRAQDQPISLTRGSSLDKALDGSASHRYAIRLRHGESAEVTVTQRGMDLVLELFAPGGQRLASADAPTGRAGDEHLVIVGEVDGTYEVLVRPFDRNEPAGEYRIAVTAWRDEPATRIWLAERAAARQSASSWLKARAGALQRRNGTIDGPGLERFDRLAAQSRVVGLGEATHGSRELGDVRLTLTRRLVERHNVRVIGLEASAARLRAIDAWTRDGDGTAQQLTELFGAQWIGHRPMLVLARFVRAWNTAHPDDPVHLIGLDAQDNAPARNTLSDFAGKAYDQAYAAQIHAVIERLAAADAQASVFGPSDVRADDWRFLQKLLGRLEVERPLLAARLGTTPVQAAVEAVRDLVQFAEFNTDSRDEPRRSRDWMMAANLLRAIEPHTRAVVWGHNAHVAHPASRTGNAAPTGQILRELLGREYGAVATSFLEGGFLAQLPNDSDHRLATFTLPPSPVESLDAVLDTMEIGDALVTWPDQNSAEALPDWLDKSQLMHWIGAVFSDEWLPHQWVQPYRLVADFDGVVFLNKVEAEIVPGERR